MTTSQPPSARSVHAEDTPSDTGSCAAATALVVPTLGSSSLAACLQAVAELRPLPERIIVVLSGTALTRSLPPSIELLQSPTRLGFAAAVNRGIRELGEGIERIALVNDDVVPPPDWLGHLHRALDREPRLAAVQGTLTDASGGRVDGRGIRLDRFGLPVQVDRGQRANVETADRRPLLAVSATAALLRTDALRQASLADGAVLDERFGSYHEDLDLGLRLRRLDWQAAWVGGAACAHLGSASGRGMRWRHPWWLLANRWRALAGNLTPAALVAALPRLLRGELRAVNTLLRGNPRAAAVALGVAAAVPALVAGGWRRRSAGPRLERLPESTA